MKRALQLLILPFSLVLTLAGYAQVVPTTQWNDLADTDWYNDIDDEFVLSTAEEFAGLSVLVASGNDFMGKTITIDSNLDLGAHLWSPIGVDHTIPFSGTVDGGGHTISNLFINLPDEDFVGLFGQCFSCTLSNINLSGVYLRATDTAGSLAGNFSTNSTMSNCHATGVDVVAADYNIGGLVGGILTNSTMTRCSAQGTVVGGSQVGGLVGSPWDLTFITECFSTGTVSGLHLVGGLIGYSTFAFQPNRDNTLNNCYSRSNVSVVNGRAGGLCGASDGNLIVQNSYATGTATGPEFTGGLVGAVGSVILTNAYWDVEASAQDSAVGGWLGPVAPIETYGKTTAEMKTAQMVNDLNQEQQPTPWTIDPQVNDGYPILDYLLVSTPEVEAQQVNVSVYPTLFETFIQIESEDKIKGYTLHNIAGQVMTQASINALNAEIDTQPIAPGVCILVVETERGIRSQKVVKI